ncbi:hypothetical protein [Flavobacterium psychrotrophum]|uniref:hypothetical protein n=1 Tax=Flavobacterium psychrotrophum TaxID=2294119 RepID=UPI000E31D001|nr:hypothetical protein [Flavobacterium psychrotrophum]
MAIEIRYTEWFGDEILPSQIATIEKYLKEYFFDGKHIKTELYIEQELKSTRYNIEDLNDIGRILNEDPNAGICYIHKELEYLIEEVSTYEEAVLKYKIIAVDELHDQAICYAQIDVQTGLPKLSDVEKYYNVNGERKYLFTYDANGECEKIWGEDDYTEDVWPSQIGVRSDVKFTWDGFEYYRYALPIIPEK